MDIKHCFGVPFRGHAGGVTVPARSSPLIAHHSPCLPRGVLGSFNLPPLLGGR